MPNYNYTDWRKKKRLGTLLPCHEDMVPAISVLVLLLGQVKPETALRDSLVENNTTNLLYNEPDAELPINPSATRIWGPGLQPNITLPARYFFIQLIARNGQPYVTYYITMHASYVIANLPLHVLRFINLEWNSTDIKNRQDELKVRVDCSGDRQVWSQVLDKLDGTFIVRYKVYQSCLSGFRIIVTYSSHHLGKSPFLFNVPVHPDNCNCPELTAKQWMTRVGCPKSYLQLNSDLIPFPNHSVNFEHTLQHTLEKFYHPGSHSFCHYAIVSNQIYRKCYGQHVGFHIFPDAILLFLTRRMYLSDVEFIMNLGDWPLVQKQRVRPPLPMFSWCKSNDTSDIVLPTYELTEASLEAMGRVSLDMMTVQANSPVPWESKIPKLFWRGRDSRRERLDLISIGRRNPDLFNVSLTNFFFFRDKEEEYGPKAKHVSFFQFFMYKYQLNIDGTVAAYRFPFLLGGDSVILKVDSPYFEYFYRDLSPWVHYIPVKSNLEDVVDKIQWARDNDAKAKAIGARARQYALDNLLPLDVFCYHVTAYQEWSNRLKNPVGIRHDMEIVKPKAESVSSNLCSCVPKKIVLSENETNGDEKLEL